MAACTRIVSHNDIKRPTLWAQMWCRRGILKSTKIGRTYFIKVADLDELLAHGAAR